MQLIPIQNQVVVITGATSGIGLATARAFAKRGARLALIAREENDLRKVAQSLAKHGGDVLIVPADVGVRAEIDAAARIILDRFGRIDTWVNNAGVGAYAKLEDISDEDHERLFRTNYWGVVFGSLAAVRIMKRRGGALINVGSIASDMGSPLLSAYAASKHAVKGFTDSLRLELMHQRAPISVTLIKPSGIDTPFGDHARNYMREAAQVPPPVYDPTLVAAAIVRAAETPKRSITVGGAGVLMTLMTALLPNVADRVFADAFFALARNKAKPNDGHDTMYEGGDGGRMRGRAGFVRKTSLATFAQNRPLAAMAVLAAGAGAVALAANGNRSRLTAA